jgi:hypothetical protein
MTRITLLTSSFSPMGAIIAIRVWEQHRLVSWILLTLSVVSTLLLWAAIVTRKHTSLQPFTVESVRDETYQAPAYLLGYVFPFIFVEVNDKASLIAYGIFGALLVILVFRSNLFLGNPLFLLFGFRIYSIETAVGSTIVLVGRSMPLKRQQILASHLLSSAYLLGSPRRERA